MTAKLDPTFTSHLAQLASTALAATVAENLESPDDLQVVGSGLSDMTRLAKSSYEIWRDILATNTDSIERALAVYIPAQIAGVKEICLCSPMRDGQISPAVLAAAHKLGISEIYAIGGAQAIAAMAFGTATIRPVDKIVGPGNTYVQLAKKELFGIVDIDSFAGPSEVIVLADDSAAPQHVAAELLAQAEHAPGSCILVTTSESLATAVQQEVERQLKEISREALTRKALEFASAIIVVPSHEAALAMVDRFAPEHLQITTRTAREDAHRIKNAGAIFIGPFTPVAAGDYLAGPSHVLPTSGTGRFFSGLSADSFRKRTSLIELDQKSLDALGQHIVNFAITEGFDAHAKSVSTRAGG